MVDVRRRDGFRYANQGEKDRELMSERKSKRLKKRAREVYRRECKMLAAGSTIRSLQKIHLHIWLNRIMITWTIGIDREIDRFASFMRYNEKCRICLALIGLVLGKQSTLGLLRWLFLEILSYFDIVRWTRVIYSILTIFFD